jgi:hypothetical protein
MIDFIQRETKKIMFKCCEKYANERKMDIENVQLILGLNESGNTYTVCENFVPKEEKTFLGVLGVVLDFKGYSLIAPQFITKSLIRFSENYKIGLDKIKVMCVPQLENNKPDVLLFVYNGNEYVETISFPHLFREEDLEIPT